MPSSSRSNSSLSQQSNSAGDEQRERERQVSDELEQFEGISLRGSVSRRCYRDPLRATPHFAINPLLHLDQSSANDRSHHDDNYVSEDSNEEQTENLLENTLIKERSRGTDKDVEQDGRSDGDSMELNSRLINEQNYLETRTTIEPVIRRIEWNSSVPEEEYHHITDNLKTGNDFRKLISGDWNRVWDNQSRNSNPESNTTIVENEELIIPRYNGREESPSEDLESRDLGDRDSGMCSIESRDSEIIERNRWKRLYQVENSYRHSVDDQILSIGGKKFFTAGGYNYHTFGGIRIRVNEREDLDDDWESISSDDQSTVDLPEFAQLKFQTFGGISRSKRIHDKRIPNYRRIRLRPILSKTEFAVSGSERKIYDRTSTDRLINLERSNNTRESNQLTDLEYLANFKCPSSTEIFTSLEHSSSMTSEESDWQDEEDNIIKSQIHAISMQNTRHIGRNQTSTFSTSSHIKRRNSIGKNNRFSQQLLSRTDDKSQDEAHYTSDEIIMNKFLKDVSKRRKASDDDIVIRGKKTKCRKYRENTVEKSSDKRSKDSLRRNTERNCQNLKEPERKRQKNNSKSQCNNDVRCLSDVTIW